MRYKDFTHILKELGFTIARSGKGSHEVWSNGTLSVTVTYPEVNRMLARRELKRIGYADYKRV
jgi:predicted RNA binding protein YcfA (HicA-like mRNA interferase family)